MTKNTDISRCDMNLSGASLLYWLSGSEQNYQEWGTQIRPSSVLSVSVKLRSSGPARHTSRLWHRDSGRWIRPAAADRDESSRRSHESSSSRLRTTVMWLQPVQILQSLMMRIAWAQTCRALWVSHSDAVCTRMSLRKKLLHLHPIMTVHSNHCFPSDTSNCKINLLINYLEIKKI